MDDLSENCALELLCLDMASLWSEDLRQSAADSDDILVNLLPKSIRSLSLDGLRPGFQSKIFWLAKAVHSGMFPNLKYFWYVPSFSGVDNIRTAFSNTRVKRRQGWPRGRNK